eukprot:TRINITY_DN2286_c0_g1_i2.p1 TRINITY_DN2286_c0_g1~~TRINITY_DN2286_c0_g1_i2.p1  ORF type:complete len:443 (+),score=117.17 TRINITY_DN2286_c0_g1_i2:104-1432(+)
MPYEHHGHILYSVRWWTLALYAALNLVNNTIWISFASISDEAAKYYETSDFTITALSLVFLVVIIIGIVPASWIVDNKGLRFSMLLAAGGNLVGAWIKYLGRVPSPSSGIWIILIGQIVSSIGQPILLPIAPKLAAVWFSDDERGLATGVGAVIGVGGIAVAYGMGIAVVSEDPSTWSSSFPLLLLYQAAMATVIGILVFMTYQEKPPTPPSTSAETPKDDFLPSLKLIIRERPYQILLCTFGPGYGVATALFSIMGQIVTSDTLKYSEKWSGYFGIIIISCGVLGAIVSGIVIDVTRRYREIYIGVYFVAVCSFIWLILSLKEDNTNLLAAACGVTGFFLLSLLPVAMDAAVEVTYPAPEVVVTGGLMLAGNLFGAIILVVLQIVSDVSIKGAMWTIFGVAAVSWTGTWFFKGEYKRLAVDLHKAASVNSSSSQTSANLTA